MCGASGQDSMWNLLPVFSDNESSAGDRGNGLLEPDACGIVSDGCSSEPVSVDSLYGQLVLRGGTSEYPESTGLVYDDHLDLGCGNLCIHVIYKTARDSGCGSRDSTCGTQLYMCDPLEKNRTVPSVDGEKMDMKYKLKDIAKIKYGKNQKKVVSPNGKIPIYGTGGLMGYAKESLYEKTSVFIGRKGTINKVRYVTHPFWTVGTLFYTIIDEKIIRPHYFYYLMTQIDLLQLNEGTTIPSLRTETLNRIELEVPTLEKQDKILSCVEPIEQKIELNKKINNNLAA